MASKRPLRKGLRCAVTVTLISILVTYILNFGSAGFYATLSSLLLLVISDFGGPPKSRFMAYIWTGVAGMVMVAIGAFAALNLVAALVVTVVLTFALAYATVLRGYIATAYLTLLLSYIVAVTTSLPVDELPLSFLAYAIGTIVAAIASITLWPTYRTSAIRKAAGDALAVAAKVIANSQPLKADATQEQRDRLMRELVAANQALSQAFEGQAQRPGSATLRDRGLVQLVDDIERLRMGLRWPGVDTHIANDVDLALLRATEETLDACGKAIRGEGPIPVADAILKARMDHAEKVPQAAEDLLAAGKGDELYEEVNSSFYYRMAAFLTAMIVRHTQLALGAKSKMSKQAAAQFPGSEAFVIFNATTNPVQILKSHITVKSPWFRRAVQSTVGVTLAVAVVLTFHIEHGFWVVLGIVAALKLDASTTRKTALGAFAGTLAGFVIVAIMLMVIGGNTTVLMILLPFVVFLATWGPAGRFAFALTQTGFTVLFVMLGSLATGLSLELGTLRLQDVGIGLLICLFVTTVMWPKGVATEVRKVLTQAVGETADYFAASFTYITSPMKTDDLDALYKKAHSAVTAQIRADDTYDTAISQGGDIGMSAKSWTTVANSVDHVFFVSTLVTSLSIFDLAPVPFQPVAECMQKDSAEAASLYTKSINQVYESSCRVCGSTAHAGPGKGSASTDCPKETHGSGITAANSESVAAAGLDPALLERKIKADHDLAELDEMAREEINKCKGCTGSFTFQIGDSDFARTYGQAVVSTLWAQDWLLYFHWLASNTVLSIVPADTE